MQVNLYVFFLSVLFNMCSGVRRKCSWKISGVWFSSIWWSFAFGVRSLLRHNLTSYSCFQTNVLAKFVGIICIFFYTHSPYFMCHCTEYRLSVLQVRISEVNKLNAGTKQFITAKISSFVLKQGSKTHSSLRQSNLRWQNEDALMQCFSNFFIPSPPFNSRHVVFAPQARMNGAGAQLKI